ncbi:MAG: aldo/keto reductase [Paracoccaceae bacterium]
MATTKWGIIGPGAIAHNFADGLAEAETGELIAIASRNEERRKAFGDDYNIAADKRYDDYAKMAADPDIDAIYISTPHPWHAELSIMAMRAGKAVLCEKPAGMSSAEVIAMTEVAVQEDVFFMEAFMYRCHPQIARVIEIITAGEIGEVVHIKSHFGFNAPFDSTHRLYDPALGGGGILDVGGYPASLVRLFAGVGAGKRFDNPTSVKASGLLAETGVDKVAFGTLVFASGITAEIAVAVARNMDNAAVITGTNGSIKILDPWVPGRNAGPSDSVLEITVDGETRVEELKHKEHLFTFEAELVSRAIAAGLKEAPHPAVSHADSIGNNRLLDAWRAELGYVVVSELPETNRILPGVLPKNTPDMPMLKVEGVAKPMSKLVIGCDNRNNIGEGSIVWDAWIEAGGNTFDTGFVYGGGRHETVLGQWIKSRGISNDINVIAKGAHSPYCTPRTIETQLDTSLERLGLESVPIYIMHRDNPDVPVGEFVDALNALKEKGKIGMFGGSNWSVERFIEANIFAENNRLQPMQILNNNLSLAVMEKPVWNGCVTSNTPQTLKFLRETNTIHMSWSSQARGYFLPASLRDRLPADIGPEACFGSDANAERRRRAEELATERGVSAHNVATAWVIGQAFPSFALIGPRSPGELVSTLPGLTLELTPGEIAWLNLEIEKR